MIVRAWLPDEALVGPEVRAPVEAAVADWSHAWFAGRASLRLTALEPRPPLWAAELGASAWQRHGEALWIASPAPALSRLRAKALDMAATPRTETPRDAALLRGLERRMLSDLARAVERALGIPSAAAPPAPGTGSPGAECLCAIIAEPSGAEAVRLAIPREPVAAFRKARMSPPRRRDRPAPRGAALAGARLSIEARLGTAQVTLEELRALAPGDVLLLERRLDEPAELFAAGETEPFARGLLDAAERMTIIIQP